MQRILTTILSLKSKGFVLLFFALVCVSTGFSQPPETLWEEDFGQEEYNMWVSGMFEIPGGDVILAGSANSQQSYACRYDTSGEQVWYHHYYDTTADAGLRQMTDAFMASDGNIVCTGGGRIGALFQKAITIKVNANGDTVWQRLFNSEAGPTFAESTLEISGDRFLIAGIGVESEVDPGVPFIACYTLDGQELWHTYYQESPNQTTSRSSLVSLIGGGVGLVTVTRFHWSLPDQFRVWAIGDTGQILQEYDLSSWLHPVYGLSFDDLEIYEDEYLFAYGKKIVKVNTNFEIEWVDSTTFQWLTDGILAFVPLPDNTFIVCTAYDLRIGPGPFDFIYQSMYIRTTSDLDTLWTKVIADPNHAHEFWSAQIIPRSDSGYYCATTVDFVDPYIHVARLGPDTVQVAADPAPPVIPQSVTLSSFPNPFNSTTTFSYSLPHDSDIKLSLFDLLGRETKVVFNGYSNAGNHEISFTASDLPSGIYFAQLQSASQTQIQKIVLLK